MQANDVMTTEVIAVAPDTTVAEIARLLLKHRISAVPVIDREGHVVGLVSEGDLMRRVEGEEKSDGSWWLDLISGSAESASDYVKSHGRRAEHIMTRNVLTAEPHTPVSEIARLLEKNRIKRIPVVEDGKLVGIVSRANLLHGLATVAPAALPATASGDRALREEVMKALAKVPGLSLTMLNVTVRDGEVSVWGIADSDAEEKAARVAVENVAGVRSVDVQLGRVPAWAWGI